jgi:hypothetical protein
VTDDDQEIEDRVRQHLEKILAECESLVKDAANVRARRPELAPKIAPAVFAGIYRTAAWARQALAALDAGEPIPPEPTEADDADDVTK